MASIMPVAASCQFCLGVAVPSARARSRSAFMCTISWRIIALRSARTSGGSSGRHRFNLSSVFTIDGDDRASSAKMSRSAGSVVTCALNRANHVGFPSAARCSAAGRTMHAIQSRGSSDSPASATIRSRIRSISAVCLRTIARTRSAFVPKW